MNVALAVPVPNGASIIEYVPVAGRLVASMLVAFEYNAVTEASRVPSGL